MDGAGDFGRNCLGGNRTILYALSFFYYIFNNIRRCCTAQKALKRKADGGDFKKLPGASSIAQLGLLSDVWRSRRQRKRFCTLI